MENPDEVGLIMHTGDPTNMMGLGGWNLPEMVREMGLESQHHLLRPKRSPVAWHEARGHGQIVRHVRLPCAGNRWRRVCIPSIEAMACGVPIILPDNTTGPEFIGKGAKTMRGKLVKNDAEIVGPNGVKMSLVSIKALATALQWMVEHPAKRQAMGNRVASGPKKGWWDDLTDQLERLLEKGEQDPTPTGQQHHGESMSKRKKGRKEIQGRMGGGKPEVDRLAGVGARINARFTKNNV